MPFHRAAPYGTAYQVARGATENIGEQVFVATVFRMAGIVAESRRAKRVHGSTPCAQAHRQSAADVPGSLDAGRTRFGENHMLLMVGVFIVLGAFVIIPRMRVPGAVNADHLGWMSEQWLAERRAHSL